ncbi:MAG: TA system VapC family ribonuclease toxin [Verrucomicrobiota bacterium]|nr:TA system VapC family ribonuclease toxin [Verrucomicrobiota bacterium]
MVLPDNNILINAIRSETRHHRVAKEWLEETLNQGLPLRLFPTVEAGLIRVVTNPKIYSTPTPLVEACLFIDTLCSAPGVEIIQWTSAVRNRWTRLCMELNLHGNDCNDAMLAALALERGLRLVTFDQGFRRFPGLHLLLLES